MHNPTLNSSCHAVEDPCSLQHYETLGSATLRKGLPQKANLLLMSI